MPEHQQLLWYAGFGSNLNDNRFAHYIDGGSLPGLSRHHPGCRDRTPPHQAVTCIADGRMRFTGQVEAWGSGGGVSSFEPSEGRSVILRAFLITPQQMVDVLLQENRLDPSDRPDVSLRLERRIAAAYTDANVAMIPLEGCRMTPGMTDFTFCAPTVLTAVHDVHSSSGPPCRRAPVGRRRSTSGPFVEAFVTPAASPLPWPTNIWRPACQNPDLRPT